MSDQRIKIDDVEYNIDDLPQNVKEMIQRYEVWTNDEIKHKLEMEKASLARNQLNNMIIEEVRKHNAAIVKQMYTKPELPETD